VSVAAVNQGATTAPQKSVGFFGQLVLIVAIFMGTGYMIDKMQPRTPIKNAIAGLIRLIPILGPLLLLGEPRDPGPPLMQGECECEVAPDGSATAKVDGQEVPALNHEFGG
jgi:hypothetical protein